MILLIDAYNVLKYLHGETFITDSQRTLFLQSLSRYCRSRALTAIVVFDGGRSRWPEKQTFAHGIVLYSGIHTTADSCIQEYIVEHAHRDLLLVSSDRALAAYAAQRSVASIDSSLFYALMQQANKPISTRSSVTIIKATPENDPELDALMMTADQPSGKEEVDSHTTLIDRSNHLSRDDKKLLKKIKKLL